MLDQSKPDQNLLADLARAKVLFQQRDILAHLGVMQPGSKPDQEIADRQEVAE